DPAEPIADPDRPGGTTTIAAADPAGSDQVNPAASVTPDARAAVQATADPTPPDQTSSGQTSSGQGNGQPAAETEPKSESMQTGPLPGTGGPIPSLKLHSIWRDLMPGRGFFTRLPAPPTDLPLAEAAAIFPVIGALVGLGATLAYVLGLWVGLPSLMS